MTNQQGAPEALRPIQRYKIGYATDGWGERSSTPGGIQDPEGSWVRYTDHATQVAALTQPTVLTSAVESNMTGAVYAELPESLMLEVDRWFADNTGLGGCSGKDVRELAQIFYEVPASSDTLYLLRRLLSNQHTLTGPEFREELTKIVGEAWQARASHGQAPAQTDLGTLNGLAKVYADSYASPHHFTLGVNGLRQIIQRASPQAAHQAPAGVGEVPGPVRLRFFRDMTEDQRLLVFKVFGVLPEGAESEAGTHSVQHLLLKAMYRQFAAPAAPSTPASGGWISVDERLPDETQAYGCETDDCLVLLPNKRRALAMLVRAASGKKWLDQESRVVYPTHWRDVPASPTIEGESK